MSTTAAISFMERTDFIKTAIVNFDGYPSNTGRMLKEHYTNSDKVRDLLEGGDFRSMEEELDDIEYYGALSDRMTSSNSLHEAVNQVSCSADYHYVFDGETWSMVDGDKVDAFGFPAYVLLDDAIEKDMTR